MCDTNKIEYRIIPCTPFKILRGCAGCGCKQIFSSKGAIRVNANGNQIDVWLIYGCDKCGHTYNLPIHERIRPHKISKEEYQKFLANDEDIIFKYGTDKSLFIKNHAEISWENVKYDLIPLGDYTHDLENDLTQIILYNNYEIPIRKDKLVAEILQISRSKVKKLSEEGRITINITKET